MSAFPVLCQLAYRPARREAFAAGTLRERWVDRYPDLFDERDLANARSRPRKHVYEWPTAVTLYETTGWGA